MSLTSLSALESARDRISAASAIVRTPLIPLPAADLVPGSAHPLRLKAENLQTTGAFKIRGAYNKIAMLSDAERARGVVTHSSGNHAQAVALSARGFGIRAVVVMPDTASAVKIEATRALGAQVRTVPADSYREAALALAADHGHTLVPPYDDPGVVAGQGTVGLEILEDLPGDFTVLVPVGGGGLISGIGAAVKLLRPSCRVIGVEPEFAGDAAESLRIGRISRWTAAQTGRTLADGLRTPALGDLTWQHVRAYADDIITVSEAEIRASMRVIASRARLVAEPSGAVATAAFLFHHDRLPAGLPCVAVISGGNVTPGLLADVLSGEKEAAAA
ncbi:threonine ammonia-lyase [Streptomyces sp. NPDC054863]